jgi:hypothetical protein
MHTALPCRLRGLRVIILIALLLRGQDIATDTWANSKMLGLLGQASKVVSETVGCIPRLFVVGLTPGISRPRVPITKVYKRRKQGATRCMSLTLSLPDGDHTDRIGYHDVSGGID